MDHTEMAMAASWDFRLVVLSYIVAVFASYTALDLAGRVFSSLGRARIVWLAGGAFAMGAGIWSMHFTGMLAFIMPMPVRYDTLVTLLSMVIAILASALALFVVSREFMGIQRLLVAGSVMGIGIASMHYTGMAAMEMEANLSYDPLLFTASILIAISASIAALWLAFRFSRGGQGMRWLWAKIGSALVMGVAIVGMHYTGMAAVIFTPTNTNVDSDPSLAVAQAGLGFGIGITTLLILGIALVSSLVDRRFSAQAMELEHSERRYESLFSHNLDAIYLLDLAGNILSANAAAKQTTGYDPEYLRGKPFGDLVVKEDLERFSRCFEKAAQDEPQSYELAVTDSVGRRVELIATSVPILIADRVVGLYQIIQDITERKRAEEEIRRLNEALESRIADRTARLRRQAATLQEQAHLLGLTHDTIMALDLEGKISFWNQGAERMYGWTKEEALGKVAHELLETRFSGTREEIVTVLLREDRWEGELIHTRRDGTSIAVASRWSLQRDADGEPLRILEINNDITERKGAEEALRKSEARARALAETANEAIITMTTDGITRSFNPAAEHIFGYSAEEAVGQPLRMLMPERFRGAHETGFRRYLAGGEARVVGKGPVVLAGLRKDGTEFPLELSIGEMREEDDVLFTGIIRDITERRRAEERLQEAETRYRMLVERMPAVTYIQEIGAPDSATYMSPQIESLTGYSPEDCKNPDLRWRMVHPDDRERMRSKDELTGEPGEVFTTEYRVVHRDGRIVWVRNEAVMIEDGTSDSRYWQGFMVDITERKQVEEERQRAKEEADMANRAKSEFLANMSHEIRTPMNGVIGMTGLLLDTDLSPEQRDYAETIRRSGENLLAIINDVLDFSKIEAGRLDLEIIDFDLRHTVEESLTLFAERAHEKGLELTHLVNHDVSGALRGDPGRLTQILVNLLGNAIKFTEEGEVILRVELAEEADESATIRFSVTDTGVGMTEEQQGRLFQSFTQADASTTRRYGGTGLGLAISRQLVELMGGEIGVESEPRVGSTFWFTIPLEKQPEEAAQKPRTDLQDLRVLVVDDNATNREIIHQLVLSWGMMNGTAEDAQSALRVLRLAAESGKPYDVAILDMHMPDIDGIELARKIKAEPKISQVRLVLLTSLGQRGEAREAKEAGISAYLTKPVRSSQLYDTLATVMGSSEEAEEEEIPIVTRHTILEDRARSRAHLLIAEDNAVNQKVTVKMLERLGYRVDVAANGLEAVQALSHTSYAAILMDCHMPEMDGYEATGEIRRHEQGTSSRHIPIIALTASAMKSDREKALGAGMDDYITKPVKREVLEEALERWVTHDEASPEKVPAQADGAAPTDIQEESVDRTVLEGLRDLGDEEMLRELVEMFFEDALRHIAGIREAIEADDARGVEGSAHTLKGSSGNMGVVRMAALCAKLEDVGASGDLSRGPELLERIEAEIERVRPALETEITRSQG